MTYDDMIYIRQCTFVDSGRPGTITRYDISDGKNQEVLKNVTVAFGKGKTLYYAECTESVVATGGIGSVTIKSCYMDGKKEKTIATIKKVDIYSPMAITSTYFVYKNSQGKYQKFGFSKKNTKSSTETYLKDTLRKSRELY